MTTEVEVPYSEFVRKLSKSGISILEEMDAAQAELLHMGIGIAGEIAEYLRAETFEDHVEELGDLEFFMQRYRDSMGIDRKYVDGSTPTRGNEDDLVFIAGEILDVTKRYCIYQKPFEFDRAQRVFNMLEHALENERRSFGTSISRDEIIAANRAKLQKRYDSLTYSNEAAQQRADKAQKVSGYNAEQAAEARKFREDMNSIKKENERRVESKIEVPPAAVDEVLKLTDKMREIPMNNDVTQDTRQVTAIESPDYIETFVIMRAGVPVAVFVGLRNDAENKLKELAYADWRTSGPLGKGTLEDYRKEVFWRLHTVPGYLNLSVRT